MPDPQTLQSQIDAIRERYPDRSLDARQLSAALSEAAACWGIESDGTGVIHGFPLEEVARVGNSTASIRIAESPNGLFTFGLEANWGMGGFGFAPSVWGQPYATRDEARQAALRGLADRIERQGQPEACQQAALLLRKVKNRATQRTLFD